MKNSARPLLLAGSLLMMLAAGCPAPAGGTHDGPNLVPPLRDLSVIDLGDGGLDGGDDGGTSIKHDLDLVPPLRDLRQD